jgi:hypothetical protein
MLGRPGDQFDPPAPLGPARKDEEVVGLTDLIEGKDSAIWSGRSMDRYTPR